MIRLAICDPRAKARSALRQALGTLLTPLKGVTFAVGQFADLDEAVQVLNEKRVGFCTVVFYNIDYAKADDLATLAQFKATFPQTRLVLMSANADTAIHAYHVNADGFILLSGTSDNFARVVNEQMEQILSDRDTTITLKTKQGIDILDAGNILFAETSNAGPVIHLADGREVQLRGTLQALFDQMSHDPRFAKVGGSFIVNLDNIRSAGKSSLVFPDGSVIIAPIRARKPLQEAYTAYRSGTI